LRLEVGLGAPGETVHQVARGAGSVGRCRPDTRKEERRYGGDAKHSSVHSSFYAAFAARTFQLAF
jgi:hypothetical protein